uniref:Chalcone-flavonone isomerase family protein n=1 Tax=Clarkia gracilis subsp. sonomensis TaxID=1906248 RepID=A0A7S9ATD0_9MYRT|nr:chalcone isomerase [Clarkia gracilis subsp. sonomensis]QPF47151.1 chalcone isomerase [Clarkia gracilis subsp. sonomensis]
MASAAVAPHLSVTGLQIESVEFPASVKPPATSKTFFLGGSGVRGLEIQGKFVKFTAIGVYLENDALQHLSDKWKCKSAGDLTESDEFYRDIVAGPFEKFTRVTMILPLTGAQYSEKVTENCVAYWKSVGTYTDAEAKAVEKFIEVFKEETFPPGASILFTQLPKGSLAVSFSKDSTIPETEKIVIENKQLSEAVLESIIGKHGVSPQAKQSLAARIALLLNAEEETKGKEEAVASKTVANGTVAEPIST